MGHMDWGRERVRENAPTRDNKAMEGEDLPKKDKDIVDVTLEEAYDAIVMGLGIMAEGLGGDIDPDINQEAQDEILSSTGKSVDGKDEEK